MAAESSLDLAACEHCTHRYAAGNTFGQAHEIWRQAELIAGEETAGAAEAGLYFVDDEQRPALAAQAPGAGEKIGLCRAHAALTLDRFEDHGGGALIHRRVQFFAVIERHETAVGQQRREGVAVFMGHAERPQRAPVKSPHGADQPSAASSEAGELDGCFDCLGTRVTQEHPLKSSRCKLHQFFHQLAPAVVVEDSGAGDQLGSLAGDGRGDSRMSMPEIGDPNAGGTV